MNKIYSVNGPVVKVKDTKDFSMLEMVYVGEKKLIEVLAYLGCWVWLTLAIRN